MANITFPQLIQRGCGIDVHSKVVVATINGDGIQRETRNFNTCRVEQPKRKSSERSKKLAF